jgi:hypothetical protein
MDERHSLCLFSLIPGSIAHCLIRSSSSSSSSFFANFSSFSAVSELMFVLLRNRQTSRNVNRIVLRSFVLASVCCSGIPQILLGQKMHDHRCCICKEILLFARQTFPGVPFLRTCANRHLSLKSRVRALPPVLSFVNHIKR